MATRSAFFVDCKTETIHSNPISFKWHPGDLVEDKQRSIQAMHDFLRPYPALEVSLYSPNPLGKKLAYCHLRLNGYPLECVFQASKVYSLNGPFTEFLELSPESAKNHRYHYVSGDLSHFRNVLDKNKWPKEPATAFYDYLFIKAMKNCIGPRDMKTLALYHYFTSIESEPDTTVYCQARSAAFAKFLLHKFQEIPEMSVKKFVSLHQKVVKG